MYHFTFWILCLCFTFSPHSINGQTVASSTSTNPATSTAEVLNLSTEYPVEDIVLYGQTTESDPQSNNTESPGISNSTENQTGSNSNDQLVGQQTEESNIKPSNESENTEVMRLQDLLETEKGQRLVMEMAGEIERLNETSQNDLASNATQPNSTDLQMDNVTRLTADEREPETTPTSSVNQQETTLMGDVSVSDKQAIKVNLTEPTGGEMTASSTTQHKNENSLNLSPKDFNNETIAVPQNPSKSDDVNVQNLFNSPEGKLKGESTVSTTTTVDANSIINSNEKIDQLKKRESLEHTPHFSIIAGITLAFLGVFAIFGAFLIARRKKTQVKRKLMMNFDMKRLDLRGLRQHPTNVLIVDFPSKHEESWHDVKPVSSSVV